MRTLDDPKNGSTLPTHRNQAIQPTNVESQLVDQDGDGIPGRSISYGNKNDFRRIETDVGGGHILLVRAMRRRRRGRLR